MLLPRALALVAVFVFFSAGCEQPQPRCDWIRRTPESIPAGEWQEIPQGDIFEVVASKEFAAVHRDLTNTAVAPLTLETAKYFNPRYETVPGKKPYLVRAVYGHGGTGSYSVLRRGSDVRVMHGSLGRSAACNASALIINFDFVPREIYIEVSIAE